MKKMRVILASASPRRRELLKQIGIEFEIKVSNIEESAKATQPASLVEELSRQKAEAVLSEMEPCEEDILVIGADTLVALDDKVLGKPADKAEAVKMLKLLSGRAHQVYTGVTLLYRQGRGAEAGNARSGNDVEAYAAQPESTAEADGAQLENDSEADASLYENPAGAGAAQWAEQFKTLYEIKTFYEMTKVLFYPMSQEEIEAYAATGNPLDKAGAYGIQGLFARFIRGIDGDYNNVVGLPVGRLYQEAKEWMET